MMLISLIPLMAMCKVLGMGVAVRVSTSTFVFSCFIFSLWDTPKRCSSSTISRPKSLNLTSFCKSLWVPIIMSISPVLSLVSILFCWTGVLKRLMDSTFTGKGLNLSQKVWKCCSAKTVVGTSTATCLLSMTALNAALMATSVLP